MGATVGYIRCFKLASCRIVLRADGYNSCLTLTATCYRRRNVDISLHLKPPLNSYTQTRIKFRVCLGQGGVNYVFIMINVSAFLKLGAMFSSWTAGGMYDYILFMKLILP